MTLTVGSRTIKESKGSIKMDEKDTFVFLGGMPVLDFCNTELLHRDSTHEFLKVKEDVRAWLRELKRIYKKWNGPHPLRDTEFTLTDKQFEELLSLRQALRAYFQAIIDHDHRERTQALSTINRFLEGVLVEKKIVSHNGRDFIENQLKNSSKAPIFLAAEWLEFFLTDLKIERVKRCKNPNCSHFFYDVSKNNSREWCSMRSCGNIMKARAFYKRKKRSSS